MKPFKIPLALESIIDIYPTVKDIVKAINVGDKDTCYALARLWLSEGIPFCFKSQPAIYEGLRLWLSRQLEIQAKEITIIGSGRQGFCLSPDENLGRSFGEHSDMDLSIVSQSLFQRLKITFNKWHTDYIRGSVLPRNEKEKEYWVDNARRVPDNLRRGFIDSNKIPTFDRYPEAKTVRNTIFLTHEKLKATPGAPLVTKVSLRVYNDWDAFITQLSINLERLSGVKQKLKVE